MKLSRRGFIAGCASSLPTGPLAAHAQQPNLPIVGWLNPQPLSSSRHLLEGFIRGLGDSGFVDGKTVHVELRAGPSNREQLARQADDLVRRGVAAIMAGSPPAALAAKRATGTIPIVFTSGADPIGIGLVPSFSRPGGNLTGFHIQYSQLVGKRLSLLHEMVPNAKRIAVLVNPEFPSDAEATVKNATEAARVLGLHVKIVEASSSGAVDAAFAAIADWRGEALLIGPDPFLESRFAQVVALAARYRLPNSGFGQNYASAGGLMSYGLDLADLFAQAGGYVGRILKGEKPGNLPVQQPTKFQLKINLKTARQLGIEVPAMLLTRADEVIE